MTYAVRINLAFGNNHDRFFKDRVGSLLRNLADRVDGRRSQALTIEVAPALTEAQISESIVFGLEKTREALDATLRAEAVELVANCISPGLYDRRKNDDESLALQGIKIRRMDGS